MYMNSAVHLFLVRNRHTLYKTVGITLHSDWYTKTQHMYVEHSPFIRTQSNQVQYINSNCKEQQPSPSSQLGHINKFKKLVYLSFVSALEYIYLDGPFGHTFSYHSIIIFKIFSKR